nr:hypothetical protein [Tanacetum cinerariifolium]
VIVISVILVSSDSSEDSMGTPAGRVILFGTIPTTIPDTTPVIAPPTTQTYTTGIPTETPIIAPTIPPSPDYTHPLGQPIPHGRSYRYHANGPVHMMTARKMVRPLPIQKLTVRHSVDRSSSDSSSRHSLGYCIHGRNGEHRFRLSPVCVDLIPSPKRVMDIGYLADVEVRPRETRVERVRHLAMPEDIPEPAREGAAKVTMGTPAGRVILFGTIPTTIPDTTPVIAPPTTQTYTTGIPTETPIIAPTIPPSPDYTPASLNYSLASEAESGPSEDPSSSHIPPLPAVSPFLSSDDNTTNSDTPDTPPSPTYDTPFIEITDSTHRSPV